jgi:hypothetical protein
VRKKVVRELRKSLWDEMERSGSPREMNERIGSFKHDFRRLKKEYNRGRRSTA